MTTFNEIYKKLEIMKIELENFLSKVKNENVKDIEVLLEKIKKEMSILNEENIENELEKIKELTTDYFNFDLSIEEMHYYDFGYFFDRKDSGSCRIALPIQLDTDDVDECVEIALKHKPFLEEFANNIIYVEELTKEEAIEMGFDIEE